MNSPSERHAGPETHRTLWRATRALPSIARREREFKALQTTNKRLRDEVERLRRKIEEMERRSQA